MLILNGLFDSFEQVWQSAQVYLDANNDGAILHLLIKFLVTFQQISQLE